MTTHLHTHQIRALGWTWRLAGTFLALLLGSPLAQSQSACSSDGQTAPTALFERFISADCATCWSDPATTVAAPGALALDWIVPGIQGNDAPLSAAATQDALTRLADFKKNAPINQSSQLVSVTGWPGATLRVAHGPAMDGYLGASIELTLPAGTKIDTPLQPWLVMVETLPPGSEGSPIPRNLIRNALQPIWNVRDVLQTSEQNNFIEIRPMNIPQGAQPERLRVVGWVQDASGRVLLAVASACPPEDKK